MEAIFTGIDNTSKIENVLGETLKTLVEMLGNISEYTKGELLAYSIIETDKYLANLIKLVRANKKHIKRKHAPEIIEVTKAIAQAIASFNNPFGNQNSNNVIGGRR